MFLDQLTRNQYFLVKIVTKNQILIIFSPEVGLILFWIIILDSNSPFLDELTRNKIFLIKILDFSSNWSKIDQILFLELF